MYDVLDFLVVGIAVTVVMMAFSKPKLSFRTLLMGAKPFVVQLALLRILCFSGSYLSWFTPRTTVKSGSAAGAGDEDFFGSCG